MYARWVLTALLAWPAVAAAAILIAPPRWAKHLGFAASLIEFAISVPLWWTFVPSGGMQVVCDAPWIQVPLFGTGAPWSIRYSVGVDGISLFMVLLTTLLVPLSVLGSYSYITTRERAYYALLLVLTSGMIGVFVALDLFLFYVMWEVMLIPMYFIIGVWGGENRLYAAIKFFIYTFFGSLLMLVAILVLYLHTGRATGLYSFSYAHLLSQIGTLGPAAWWLFAAFFLAFAIKVPLFPLHTEPAVGGHPAENGDLRLPPVRGAVFPRRGAQRGGAAGDRGARADRHHLRRPRRDGPARLQKADRLLVGRAPRLRRAGDLGDDAAKRAGRLARDDQSRDLDGGAVLPRGNDLRAAAQPAHCSLRRDRARRAAVLRYPYRGMHLLGRPAGDQRFRR